MASHTILSLRRFAVFALLLATAAPVAVTAAPAAPGPAGFTARGHADIAVVTSSRTITGNMQLAVEQRGNVGRVDILSIKTDAMPLPPIRFSVIVDRNINVLTVWNDVTKTYYRQPFTMKPGGISVAPPGRTGPGKSPLALLDVLTFSMKLTGHTVTHGTPTSGLAFDLVVAKKGDTATTHVTANTQLVDDSSFFPMTFDMTIEPANVPAKASFSYAVDSFARRAPPLAQFSVPSGYTKAKSLLAAIQPAMGSTTSRPMTIHRTPEPTPAPITFPTPPSSPMPMSSPTPMMSPGMPMMSPTPMSSGMPMASPTPSS
jgi:hypothetical protein